MIIIRWFDYVYYRTYDTYKNKWGDDTPKIYALGLVSLMQQFHVFSIVFLFFTEQVLKANNFFLYASFFIFLIPNYIRYTYVKPFNNLEEKWREEKNKIKHKKGIWIVVYIIVTVILFFSIAGILGEIRKGNI